MPEHGNLQPPHAVRWRCHFKNVQSGTWLHVGDDYRVCGWQEAGALEFKNPRQIWDICDIGQGTDKVMIWNEHAAMYLRANSQKADVCLSHEESRAECFWKMECLRDSVWRIRNVQTGDVLDMAMGYNWNGVLVHAWPSHGGANQEWIMTCA